MRRVDEVGGGTTTYVVSFPKVIQELRCLVPRFPAVAHSVGKLRERLMFRHFISKVAGVQEGKDMLPRCDLSGMHMPTGRLIWHRETARCNRNSQMRWRQQDVATVDKFSEVTFSLTGEDKAERIGGGGSFKYLGSLMDQLDDDWPAVLHNIRKARQVWGRLGKLLWREGVETTVLAQFFCALV